MTEKPSTTPTSRARSNRNLKPPDRKFSDDELEAALLSGYGVVNQAAIKLKVAHRAIRDRIASNPEKWDPIVKAGRATMCELAEGSLLKSMRQTADLKVRLDAAKYTLTTLGRDLGYGTHQTVAVTGLVMNMLPEPAEDADEDE